MTNNSYDKVKLIILRAVLVLVGAGTGYLALWQYFLFYPNVVGREYQIVITVVSAATVALLFGLSAKAVYKLVLSVADATRDLKDNVGVRGIVAVVLGLAAAGALTVAFDVLIRTVVDIWAVRLLADVLAYIACASCCCVGFTKWLNAPKKDVSEKSAPPVGYLLSAECFTDERVITAAITLINVNVCDGAYKALCLYGGERGAEGAKLMDELIRRGAVSVVNGKGFDGKQAYLDAEAQLAQSKRLKRITLDQAENTLPLSLFCMPTDEMKKAVAPLRDGSDGKEKGANESAEQAVNGQIIIDK